MNRVLLSPAYILHRRAYRESSFLIELFTPAHGRLSVIAKGVRKARSASTGLLQPFTPLLVSWSGRSELLTLTHAEPNGSMMRLQGNCLFAGFYLNELLIALLQKWDAHPQLYSVYEKTLVGFQEKRLSQKFLRIFEKQLLEEIGYGFLPKNITSTQTFAPDRYYRFVPEQGFVLSEFGEQVETLTIFLGKNLLAIATEDWQSDEVLQDAKRLIRLIMTPLLGTRQIHSRRLFIM